MPIYEPVVGALLLAVEQAVKMDDSYYRALGESLSAAEDKYGVHFRTE